MEPHASRDGDGARTGCLPAEGLGRARAHPRRDSSAQNSGGCSGGWPARARRPGDAAQTVRRPCAAPEHGPAFEKTATSPHRSRTEEHAMSRRTRITTSAAAERKLERQRRNKMATRLGIALIFAISVAISSVANAALNVPKAKCGPTDRPETGLQGQTSN